MREGFLVDFDAVSIKSNVRMSGVFLKEGEQVGIIDPETGSEQLDRLEDERQFDTTDLERRVTSPDSNRKIIEELKRYALEHEQRTGRFPKTLILAANDVAHVSHADQLVRLCRDVPVLLDAGGWRSADRAFNGKLGEILSEINARVAA